jgi:hypothetical protein
MKSQASAAPEPKTLQSQSRPIHRKQTLAQRLSRVHGRQFTLVKADRADPSFLAAWQWLARPFRATKKNETAKTLVDHFYRPEK